MQLSNVPFNEITVGLPVISAKGTSGKVSQVLPEGSRVRYDSIVINWDNGHSSYVYHFQADYVQVLNYLGKLS